MANTYCNSCNSCNSCDYCNYCNSCYSCYYCNYCNSCYSCYYCNYCNSCYSCDYCYYSKGLRMSEKMIFCLGEGKLESKGEGYQKNYRAWNKDITEKRYEEILKKCREILKDFKLDPKEGWTKEWSRVRASQWKKISEIKEFDLEITKKITGLEEITTEDCECTCCPVHRK